MNSMYLPTRDSLAKPCTEKVMIPLAKHQGLALEAIRRHFQENETKEGQFEDFLNVLICCSGEQKSIRLGVGAVNNSSRHSRDTRVSETDGSESDSNSSALDSELDSSDEYCSDDELDESLGEVPVPAEGHALFCCPWST